MLHQAPGVVGEVATPMAETCARIASLLGACSSLVMAASMLLAFDLSGLVVATSRAQQDTHRKLYRPHIGIEAA